jgi:hypothetical protein
LTAALEEAKYGDHAERWSSLDYAAYATDLARRVKP